MTIKLTNRFPGSLGLLLMITLIVIIPATMINLRDLSLFIITILIFLLMGASLCMYILKDLANTQIVLCGLIFGICINLFVMALISLLHLGAFINTCIILSFNLVFSAIALYPLRTKAKGILTDSWNFLNKNSTIGSLTLMTLIALLIIWSFSAFGKPTISGYMYKDLHATDLLHHMTVSSELKKEIPPKNVYFADETLNYYWLSHLLPAFVSSLEEKSSARDLILLTTYFYSLLFMLTLILFLKQYFKDNKTILMLSVLALLMYSYKDLFVLFKLLIQALPADTINFFHFNYFLKDEWGEGYTNYSHGWFRAFLVEPQSTLSLSIILVSVLIGNIFGFLPKSMLLAGLQAFLIVINLGIDAFIGLVFGTAYAFIVSYELVLAKHAKQSFPALFTMIVAGGFFILCLFILQIFKFGESYLTIYPYTRMILLSIPLFIIDYGPLIVFGLLGAVYAFTRKSILPRDLRILVILLIVSIFFMFFVNLEGIGSTQMIRKAGNIFRIPLLIFSGIYLSHITSSRKIVVAGLCAFIALPTPFIDAYTLNNTKGVDRKYFVTAAEFKAYQWIKENTGENAIIQDIPHALTPVAAFAERKTVLGDWEHARCYGIGIQKISERHKEIYGQLFSETDGSKAVDIIKKYRIDYILVAPGNDPNSHDGSDKFVQFEKLFHRVYSEDGVKIYRVSK